MCNISGIHPKKPSNIAVTYVYMQYYWKNILERESWTSYFFLPDPISSLLSQRIMTILNVVFIISVYVYYFKCFICRRYVMFCMLKTLYK